MATATKAKPKTPIARAPVTKAPPAKKAAPPVAAKAPAKPKWQPEKGDHVQFLGYPADYKGDVVFEAGQTVVVAEISENEKTGVRYFSCVADDETYESHKRGEDVTGDELQLKELKELKAPAIPKEIKDPHDELVFKDDEVMTEMVAKGDLVASAKKLYADIQKAFYYLGGALAHIYKERKYEEMGYKDEEGGKIHNGWERFCEEEMKFSGRKGFELIQVYSRFSLLENVDQEKLLLVGSSKAVALARYINQENVDELLNKALETPIRELKEELKIEYTDEQGNAHGTGVAATRNRQGPAKIKLVYEVFSEQADQVKLVIAEAKRDLGLGTDGEVLEHIISEWAQEHLGEKQKEKIGKAVAKTARQIGRPVPKKAPVAA